MPKISIVMPVYNGAQYLQKSIDSILSQTYGDFELIIINDGSKDASADIIAKNAAKDNRIVSLCNEANSGICITLNKGLDAAQGELVARMDCDDIAYPNRLELQVNYMDKHPDVDVSGTCLTIFGECIEPHSFDFDADSNMCYADMLFFTCMAHPTVIMRRSLLEMYHLRYDEHFKGVEDYHLWWRIAQFAKVGNILMPLLYYRKHKKQLTQNFDEKHKLLQKEFLDIRLADIGVNLNDEEKEPILNYIIGKHQDFDDAEILRFIMSLKKVTTHIKKNKTEVYAPLKFVCGKAISQVVDRSEHRKKSQQYYMNKALMNNCMSTIWYLKRTFYPIKSCITHVIGK